MSQENEERFRHFHKMIHAAYLEFLDREEQEFGPTHPPAVRAARFNEYITMYFPTIRDAVTPDICEAYMQRYHYITAPLDEGTEEPLTPKQRQAQACLAYSEFRKLAEFKGSKEAELLAFHDFVQKKYPLTLPDFTEDDARNAMEGWKSKRHGTYVKAVLGTLCSVALACMFIPMMQKEEEFRPAKDPTPPADRRKPGDLPSWQRTPAISPWADPALPQNDPFLVPKQPVDPKVMEQWQKTWQERLKQFDNQKGQDNKEPPERKR